MMDIRSEVNLKGVEPDLCKVMRAASQTPQGFVVTYGLRTLAVEEALVKAGNSETTHSRHLADKKGLAAAVDVTPCDVDGKVYFPPSVDVPVVYSQIAKQIEAAAQSLGIKVMWGGSDVGAWVDGVTSHFHDWGHYQLEWGQYP